MVLATMTIIQVILIQREISSQKREEYYVKNRIKDMNDLYDNIIRDSGKSLDIITKRAISISTSNIIISGSPLTDADEVIEELILEGTFNGTQEFLMENSTLADWSERMSEIGDIKGYYLNTTFLNLEVKPYDSFNLLVESDLRLNITDKNDIALIARNATISQIVSISEFEDVLYPLNTNGMVTQKIEETTTKGNFTQLLDTGMGNNSWVRGLTLFLAGDYSTAENYPNKSTKILVIDDPTQMSTSIVNEYMGLISDDQPSDGTNIPYVYGLINLSTIPNNTKVLLDGEEGKVWYIEDFVEHIVKGYYSSGDGPSFLDRLEGKFYVQSKYLSQASRPIGLESFVNKTNMLAHQLDIEDEKTNVDYLYFSNTSYPGSPVKSVDGYFRIDSNHSINYGVDQILE
jgi:hypothetical protein